MTSNNSDIIEILFIDAVYGITSDKSEPKNLQDFAHREESRKRFVWKKVGVKINLKICI